MICRISDVQHPKRDHNPKIKKHCSRHSCTLEAWMQDLPGKLSPNSSREDLGSSTPLVHLVTSGSKPTTVCQPML